MVWTNNSFLYWLTSQKFSSSYQNIFQWSHSFGYNRRTKFRSLEFSYFLWFVVIFMFITVISGTNREEYFSDTPIDLFGECSIFVELFISGSCFGSNCSDVKFTVNPPPPPFWYKLYELRKNIFAWNYYMQIVFILSWISWLDESMSIWLNRFIFPGFFFWPHKHPPKG